MDEADNEKRAGPGSSPSAIQKAVSFLARREHSRRELAHKLSERGYPAADIDAALQRLAEKGLQSDERFAEAFVQSRIQRGHGPVKIRLELRQRGIADQLINLWVESSDYDWFELAYESYLKKYGDSSPEDYQDKARRMRFLQQRGFDAEQCKEVINRKK